MFSVSLKGIDIFEKNNKVSIHVFGYEKEVYPLRISKYVSEIKEDLKAVDLLLISEGDIKHYCWIKNLSRLMSIEGNHHAMHYCRRCINGFTSKEALSNHNEYCSQQDTHKIVMPEPETML